MITSNINENKSFADNLNLELGIVSSRVALLLRSTEIKPLFSDFFRRVGNAICLGQFVRFVTDCAITSLTSEIGRDPVFSSVYGPRFELALLSKMHLECTALDQLGHPGFFFL
ncbi:hypothetical protein H8356DRAFT_1356358 [Neocallimastix lanati (nom. inval.)]|nr:hypothetical protein H8356DRAFT_1356358 [Neocallimastix sp. JGI-2020a]